MAAEHQAALQKYPNFHSPNTYMRNHTVLLLKQTRYSLRHLISRRNMWANMKRMDTICILYSVAYRDFLHAHKPFGTVFFSWNASGLRFSASMMAFDHPQYSSNLHRHTLSCRHFDFENNRSKAWGTLILGIDNSHQLKVPLVQYIELDLYWTCWLSLRMLALVRAMASA